MNNFKCNHFHTACFFVECKMELLMVSCWVVIFFIKGFIIFYFKNVACRLEFISLEHSLINLQLINLIQYLMYKVEKENVNCSFRSLGILPVHSGVLKLKIFLKNLGYLTYKIRFAIFTIQIMNISNKKQFIECFLIDY